MIDTKNDVDKETSTGNVNITLLESIFASSLAIVEGLIIFVIKGMLGKNTDDLIPSVILSANQMSGIRKTEFGAHLPKVCINAKCKEFVLVYGKISNNSSSRIASYKIGSSETLSSDLLPNKVRDIVVCIYLAKGKITKRHFLLYTQYVDMDNNIFKGLDMLIIDKSGAKASVRKIIRARKCRLCIK